MPIHVERNVTLQSGQTVDEIRLSYAVYGDLNAARDNLVVFPTYFTGRQSCNEPYFGAGRALDPSVHCILVPSLIGNSDSSSPSNTAGPRGGAGFPHFTIRDNVRLQRALIDAVCPVERVALVIGWSMGGCQTFEWAAQFPNFVARALPFCSTAMCSAHNRVFLEGVKAALTADGNWADGNYVDPPVRGLRAFGRAYAGWAYSGTFFNRALYRTLGFENAEALLQDWERDHLTWDANDLLCKVWTWQHADISANRRYRGDLAAALSAIEARTIVMPTTTDMYFAMEQAKWEAILIPNAEFRPFVSSWGHCAATPSASAPGFMTFLDTAISDLMND
ncbi:alpha/beta fold hydrolase [Methyloceanibacter sp.]|uniref:alpha/beta fold hydrolase n=1 Tax=Methyloceanibacter sp. TaxID=1965321 RepID=UPI002CD86B88|nr:alpha/beta fold hydrolase [Methyloceanibacter sp.]HML90797.1 alpha/beta fold hydrolase [Methyloceanibacter sp.]